MEKQLSLGITYINNGEMPRLDYVRSTVDRISGFGDTGTAPIPRDLEELPELSSRFGGRNGLITLNPKAPVTLRRAQSRFHTPAKHPCEKNWT